MKLKGGVVLAILIGTLSAVNVARADANPKVLVYGDSLMKEASSTIETAVAGSYDVTIQGMAGRAPCDFLKVATKALSKRKTPHYDLFVVETAGNSSTACMKTPGAKGHLKIGSPEWETQYQSDLDALVTLMEGTGTKVLFVSPPVFAGNSSPRNDVYVTVEPLVQVGHPDVLFTDGPRVALSNDGAFTSTLPCLPTETEGDGCTDGMITVRAPDSLHFCPTGFSNQIRITGCSVYDGGGLRFGQAVADAIYASMQ